MKNKHIWIPAFVFIGAAVVSLVYSVIDYKTVNKSLAYSSETIQFNYDGASDGKDPNGNSFNPTNFLSDDVIASALAKNNLNYKVEDVRPYISMRNVVPKNIVEEINSYEKIIDGGDSREITSKDYHPVRYSFVVYQDMNTKLSAKALNEFTKTLADEYCDKFYKTYKKTFAKDAYATLFDVEGYDYTYQNQIFITRFNVLLDYAKSVYQEHDKFVDKDGKSFKDLYLKAEQLINSDADRINKLIVLNALSNDIDKLKDYYTYLKEQLTKEKAKYEADRDAIADQITTYVANNPNKELVVASTEGVIRVDSNTTETYNALMAKQVSINNTITSLTRQIQECDDALTKLNSASSDPTIKATVESLLTKLSNDYQDLEDALLAMIEVYNDTYVKDGIVSKSAVRYNSASLISSGFIVHAIKKSAPIMLTTMLGIAIFYLVRAIRKEKEVKAA